MGKMRYKIRGIRPRAPEEKSSEPKLSIIIKGIKQRQHFYLFIFHFIYLFILFLFFLYRIEFIRMHFRRRRRWLCGSFT